MNCLMGIRSCREFVDHMPGSGVARAMERIIVVFESMELCELDGVNEYYVSFILR